MAIVNLTLTFIEPVNVSVYPGDIVYYSSLSSGGGGFEVANTSSVIKLGIVSVVTEYSISVTYDNALVTPPDVDDYIMFEKDKRVNSSSLKGYYATVDLVNNSTDEIELFAFGSEISESSK